MLTYLAVHQVFTSRIVFEQKTPTLKKHMGKKRNLKKRKRKRKKGTLAGARTRVNKLEVAPKLFGPAAFVSFFFQEKVSHYTRHMHA